MFDIDTSECFLENAFWYRKFIAKLKKMIFPLVSVVSGSGCCWVFDLRPVSYLEHCLTSGTVIFISQILVMLHVF